MRSWVFAVCAALTLAGCANGYQKFFEAGPPHSQVILSQEAPVILPASGKPKLDIDRMYEEGYWVLGAAEFNGAIADTQGAVAQARKIGANRILIWTKYTNTVSGVMPVTTPTTTTAYTSGTITPRGYGYSGGSASYSGTTTIYGSQTTYVPYSVSRYDQYALYFAPMERKGTGLLLIEPTDEVRQQAGTNKGLQVRVVRRGSPAFQADIMAGDLIVAINGYEIVHRDDYPTLIAVNEGKDVEVTLYRGSVLLSKRLAVLPRDLIW